MDKAVVEISFGALCHPTAKQLKEQGVTMNVGMRGSCGTWQKDADAITRLAVRHLLPESATRNARQKLLKNIIRGIEASGNGNAPANLKEQR
jgi:hypothetical protein